MSSREGIIATHVYSMSPADRAGLREGDVLLQLDGVALGTRDEMSAVLERHHPQDRVSLEYVRGSRRQAVEIVLDSPAEMFVRACDAGVPEGCHHLGLQYLEGNSVSPDEARGRALIRSACEAGDADACSGLRQTGRVTVTAMRHIFLFALLLAVPPASAAAEPPGKLKLLVSVDMEGIAGVVSGDQLGPSSFEYARFREFMTREALAAVDAAREAGATEIVVADSHGNGENLLIEQFPKDVRIVRSWPRPFGMMGGIDASFDAAILIGYHASTDNPRGVRAHTFRSALFTHVGVNGKAVSEGFMSAALAGQFGVPVVMASGDDVAMAELRAQIGPIETAEVKRALGFHSAETLTPAASCELIGRKVKAALARRGELKPLRVEGPVALEISLKHYLQAEVAAYLPGTQRVDSHTVRFRVASPSEAVNVLTFLDNWDQELSP